MTPYTEMFRKMAPNHDPRHIEAYIRLQYSTLDHLSKECMRREVAIAKDCVEVGGVSAAEACALSFGL